MFEEHPQFICPPDDTVLWRYLSFTKLASLLDRKAMYFCRADLLGDPYEGSFPKGSLEAREQYFKKKGYDEWTHNVLKAYSRYSRRHMYVNCWHINPIESDAMWKLYTLNEHTKEGIAIRTTFRKLRDCFNETQERLFLGQVSYADYGALWMGKNVDPDTGEEYEMPFCGGGFGSVLVKRQSFEHEKELRCLFWQPHVRNGKIVLDREDIPSGYYIQADLNHLIEAVYIAPNAGNWFKDLTVNLLKMHGYSFDVVHSSLSEDPVF